MQDELKIKNIIATIIIEGAYAHRDTVSVLADILQICKEDKTKTIEGVR